MLASAAEALNCAGSNPAPSEGAESSCSRAARPAAGCSNDMPRAKILALTMSVAAMPAPAHAPQRMLRDATPQAASAAAAASSAALAAA
jgi:hypothetical protein